MDLKICFFLTFCITAAMGQFYEDRRCRCVCPSPASIVNHSASVRRRYYTMNVPPMKCNCANVVLPRIAKEIKGHEHEFCPKCDCHFEVRNTTVIKVVVIMVLWLLTLLSGYMGFLLCLDPFINKRRVKVYQEELGSEEAHLLLDADEFEY